MTPKTLLLTAAIVTLTGAHALANSFKIINPPRYDERNDRDQGRGRRPPPGRQNPGYPGHVRPGPVRPGPVYPGPIYGAPVYPNPVQYIQRVLYINRYVINETFYIDQMANLSYSAQGYALESVTVELSQSNYGANTQLLVNGMVEATAYNINSFTTLFPIYRHVFGYDLGSLALRLNGSTYVGRITINLRLN